MRVMRSLLTLFVALALGIGVAPEAHAATVATTLTGQVIGYSGVADIVIYQWTGSAFTAVPDRDDQTASDGTFSITLDLNAGDVYTLRASAVGYGSRYYGGYTTKPTTADAGFVAGASPINLGTFALGTTYTLSGTVLDETGVGFAGATVKLFAPSADPATDAPLFTGESTTGDLSNGDYGFQVPAGSYRVVASAPGYVSASTTGTITVASITVADLSLVLGQSQISGTVTLPSGSAAAGASVQVYRWVDDDWSLDQTVTAGSDGGYQFSVSTKSKLALFAKAKGYIGTWSGGGTTQPMDSTSSGVLTATDGLTASLQLSTAFGAVAGQDLSYCTAHTLTSGAAYNEAKVALGFTADLYGSTSQNLFVTDRGLVYLADSSHASDFSGSDPSALDTWSGVPVIAPLWFDADTSGAVPGSVTYGSSSDGQSFCVRWNNLGHYSQIEDSPNTFQLILQSRAGAAGRSSGDFDITFNYDQVLWDGSSSRAVGYSAGDAVEGHFWVYDGSSNPGVITDSGSSPLVTHSVGSDVLGRYFSAVENTPVNTDPPAISVVGGGPAAPRVTLSANVGTWSPAPSAFTYQWLLDGAVVDGATGNTWVVPDNTEGKKISVVVSSDVDVADVAATSSELTVVGLENTGTPSISGSAIPGGTLTAGEGSWSLSPDSLTYQWLLDGSEVPGATGRAWVIPAGTAAGRSVTARVTAHRAGMSSASALTDARAVSRFEALQTPTISGSPVVGTVLKLSESWSLEPTSRSYSWYLNGSRVSTSATYKVPPKSEGKLITAVILAKKDGYSDVTASAAAVKVLRVFSKKPTPSISGTVKVGSTLTAKSGTWSPTPTRSYRWYRNGSAIAGATKSKYKAQLADVGQKLTVQVTATKSGYLQVIKGSKATKTVPKVALKTSTPSIVGTTKVGSILTAKPGSWTSGATLRFAWYRSGKLIAGASASTYQLQIADRGKTITVKVTGSKTGYTTVTKTSKATKKIA